VNFEVGHDSWTFKEGALGCISCKAQNTYSCRFSTTVRRQIASRGKRLQGVPSALFQAEAFRGWTFDSMPLHPHRQFVKGKSVNVLESCRLPDASKTQNSARLPGWTLEPSFIASDPGRFKPVGSVQLGDGLRQIVAHGSLCQSQKPGQVSGSFTVARAAQDQTFSDGERVFFRAPYLRGQFGIHNAGPAADSPDRVGEFLRR
jgi:hypothetical protein